MSGVALSKIPKNKSFPGFKPMHTSAKSSPLVRTYLRVCTYVCVCTYVYFRVWVRYIFRLLSFVHCRWDCMRIIELLGCTCELMYIAELIDYSRTPLFPPLFFSTHLSTALHSTIPFSLSRISLLSLTRHLLHLTPPLLSIFLLTRLDFLCFLHFSFSSTQYIYNSSQSPCLDPTSQPSTY